MRRRHSYLLFLIIFSPFSGVRGQNTIGLPQIINYPKNIYQAGTQSWDIQQDKKGVLYFANNSGLLTFNGHYWHRYSMPNETIVRSVRVGPSGRIYVGAQDEFGYFFPGANGDLVYTSLKSLIPAADREFPDVWDICILGDEVFFRAENKIFLYKDQTIAVYPAPSEWRFMDNVGDEIFAQDKAKGLMRFREGSWQPLRIPFGGPDTLVTTLLPYNRDTLLVGTLRNGLYLMTGDRVSRKYTQADAFFATNRIYCGTVLGDSTFALGSTSAGCVILNRDGKVIQTLSRAEGLQNNNILSLFLDREHNLWVAMDNGISFVAYNTAITYIYPDKNNELAGYAARIYQGKLYIGTSDGLYSVPLDLHETDLTFSKGAFSKVQGTNGQVWNLSEVNGRLLMGHHEGAFTINENAAVPLLPGVGSWLFAPVSSVYPSPHVIVGTYLGLDLLDYQGNTFHQGTMLPGLTESLRFLAIDNDNRIWTSHPYRGVFKIELAPDHKSLVSRLYTAKDGLPKDLNNYVYRIKNRVVVATEQGVYEYDPVHDRFVLSEFMEPVFHRHSVRYLREDDNGNIWFVSSERVGIVDYRKPADGNNFSLIYFPELTGKAVGGFEYLYPYNDENVFINFDKGFFHLNYTRYLRSKPELSVLIGQVRATGRRDSLLFGGYFSNGNIVTDAQGSDPIQLPNQVNSFHFEYASTLYEQQDNIAYSYQLTGFDKGWSDWTKKTEKEYTNLPAGTYTFQVKARNNLGNESKPATYTFTVEPAWYQSLWAYLFYALLFCGALYVASRYQRRKFARQQQKYEEEQDRLRYLHQLELDANEKQIVQLKNDKLETDVNFKNKELASVTMHLVQRGKLLSNIKEDLVRLQRHIDNPVGVQEFKKVIRLLNDDESNEEDWEHFSIHFDQVHSNFLANLKGRFPSLTSTDLKLCAYLRMNLSSKEIAQLMNISLRGVEISRYRLRKKLLIPTDANLYDYLIQVTGH
ncbi:MAG TPA: triple tyrosine motif-containing protein [Dinghuibacter sp.]|uniref:triple tyrosine motif-containing protein n=1 Tax=Dinghuibacter sp. TaxID=2024697 RepID=UPI002B5274D0|nr:triple tyrosine motif-containing protein [Dinghuibacter sp.]HTJ12979.1 triple tyrosine motif-containing protein [Dinghuibacter sp.]